MCPLPPPPPPPRTTSGIRIAVVKAFGAEVVVSVDAESRRDQECLCLNCGSLPTCPAAEHLCDFCKQHNMAMTITRCPSWIPPREPPIVRP